MKHVRDGFRSHYRKSRKGDDLRQGDIAMIIALYVSGKKVADIADVCDVCKDTVNNVCRRYNVPKRNPKSGRWGKGRVNNNA